MKSYFALIAVGLDAAATRFKSKIEKMAASVAADFVGIGLLAVPLEQAQAGIPVVSEVNLIGWDWFETGDFTMEVVNSSGSGVWAIGSPYSITYWWSGVFYYALPSHPWFWEWCRYWTTASNSLNYYHHPAGLYEYYICKMVPYFGGGKFNSSDWVEVWFWTGDGISPPSASVYDSDGNFYHVDLAIDGYVISGPSMD